MTPHECGMITRMEDISPRPLAIIKLGETFDTLRERRGDFEHWMAAGLGNTRLPVVVLDPRRGDTLPRPAEISGAIVSGSHAMVSHREPWSEATGAWLAQLVASRTPVLGICFGHQLLAHALGGEAGDHPGGMEIGTVEVELTPEAAADPLMHDLPPRFDAHVVHRQSALRLPAGAVRLAGNDFERTQAFRIGENAWGVQFHPEFDADIMRGYVDHLAEPLRAEGVDPAALRDRVAGTATAARLLGRFAHIAEEHDAAAHPGRS
ncbi:glutamine amidotransferase [Variovorax sp. J22R24]|uniref:glutamine amidotransferase n=1 Tax=Variovorax gracilis TaxID=3053502 RepID=UPI0025782146|nr:glutamine amidotransferase [Variovorax sp. J22R24]MDM0104032.1 glutamine amidotransferase [Variovorax sp. J22R24]